MREVKLIKKSTIALKSKMIKTSLFFSVLLVALLLVISPNESYSLPFEGNMMGSFPTVITDQKENIIEVYFINETRENIDNRYNKASIKADLTYNSTGSVKGWLEKDTTDPSKYILYVGSVGKTYLYTGRYLFEEWINTIKFDFANIDTSMVTYMNSMFSGCINAIEFDLSNFDTSNVTDMGDMFSGRWHTKGLKVERIIIGPKFDTSKVTKMSHMFYRCNRLTSLDVSNFDTSNVTSMSSMFYGCSSLTSLDLSNFDTSNVTSMSYMFYGCSSLTSLVLSNFDTSNVTSMSYMFYGCSSLTSLDLTNFKFKDNTNLNNMLYNVKLVKMKPNGKFKTGKNIVVLGDVDGDGNLNLSDIMTVAKYLYKDKTVLSGVYLQAVDYDQDNLYSLSDIMSISKELYKGV